MGIKECKLWDDVFDEKLDDLLAPELFEVVSGKAHEMYTDPYEFFVRTYFSDSILDTLSRVVKALKGEANNILTLYSLFGGGKTHTLLAIYHAFRKPEILRIASILKGYSEEKRTELTNLAEEIEKLEGADIVVIHGKSAEYSARPANPLKYQAYGVKTLWGYLAHSLGRYDAIREDDDSLTAPAVESIREVLKGKKVIILVDELIDYADNLRRGGNETERRYTENIPAFLDRLSTALVGTNSVMIVSLPIEVKEGKIQKVEERYDEVYLQRFLNVLNSAISRVGSVALAPLRKHEKGDDIVEVIKKRVFEEVPKEVKSKALREMEISIKTNPEVFGHSTIDEIQLTYPYHPELIEILEEIIKRAKLQKTRDMLKYARIIVRGIWATEEKPLLVMPWHINLFDDRVVKSFFSSPLDSYAKVVEKDLVENTKKFSKPELVKLISTVVLLKTYVYDSPIPLHGFPMLFSIANMVYEPQKFMKNNWNPSDIPDALEEVSSNPNMIFLNEKDGVFWFWRIANVNEQIDSEKERIRREEQDLVLTELKKFVEALTFGKRPQRKGKPAKVTPIDVKIFKKSNFKVTSDPEVEIPNDDAYKLIVYVGEPTAETIYSLVYHYREGERRFRNTVVVMYPGSRAAFGKCEDLTARLLACEAVAEKLNEIYAGMPNEVKSIQKSLVDKIKSAAETELQDAILSAFRSIAYPHFEDGRQIIGEAQSSETAVSLVEHAYLALNQPLTGKIIEELSYDTLKRYVEDVMQIELGASANHSIGTIRDWFRTNPALPMIEDDALNDAITEGARGLKLGISNGNVWFKPVRSKPPESGVHDEGVVPLLKNEYKVLSWQEALDKQVKGLLSQEGEEREGNRVIKRYHEVYYENTPYRLREVVDRHPDEWFDLVKEGFIVLRSEIIEHGFDVRLTPSFVEVEEDKSVEVTVDLRSYSEPLTVKLSVDQGTVEPEEGITPFNAVWNVSAKEDETIELVAEALGFSKAAPLTVRIRKGIIRKAELSTSVATA
jgi:predicted AAA+ superfamily ATPase